MSVESDLPSTPASSAVTETTQSNTTSTGQASQGTPAADTVAKIAEKVASGEQLTKKEESKLKEYKLKVNGYEKSVKFNPNDDAEVIKYLQKAEASDSKFKEAAEVRKAAMQFIEELRKNPRKVLTDPNIGIDVKKFAEEIINEQLAEMEKSPEQKEKEKLQKQLDDITKQSKEKEEKWNKAEFTRMQAEQEKQLSSDIESALDVGGMPKTPRTVARMAEMMMIALNNNIDLSAKDIAPMVKDNTMSDFKEIVTALSDDQLEDFLGKEVIGRLRKRNVAKAKAVDTISNIKSTGTSSKPKEKSAEAKKQTIKDFLGI